MCGIAGIIELDGRPLRLDVLERMVASLAHRGPDARGHVVVSGGTAEAGLSHARLKIVDLSDSAGQPMASDDGAVHLVFNGEIYNFRALRSQLEGHGHRFKTASDTEVLLRLYEAEGERCVERLDGMFAFAIWDGRRQCAFLARDRMGKKPLFYWADAQRVVFASELKALLVHPEVPADINTEILPALFLWGYAPSPATVYRGILQLGAGCCLRVDVQGGLHSRQYWDVPVERDGGRAAVSEREAAAQVRELVTAAVRRRLVADVPLGAFLSGGLDSSIIVGLMSRLMPGAVRTFSIGFAGDPRFDETAYARLASERFRTSHTEFVVEPSAVGLVEELVRHHDGPFADSSAIPTYLLSRLTRQHVTVVLNGDGGDELFAGYLRFYAAVISERVPGWLRSAAKRGLSALPELGHHGSPFRRLQKFAGSACLPLPERLSRWVSVFYDDLPKLFPGRQGSELVPQALAHLESHLARCRGGSPLSRILYLNAKTYLLDDLLVKMDRCSMAHGLEARSPFLDRELIEYVFRLPDAMKLRWGRTKVVLRRAFADLVPEPIAQRGKMGFGVPLRRWFAGDLRDYLQDILLAGDAKLRDYVDAGYVREVYRAHLSGYADHSHRLWTLLTFEVWLRQFSRMKDAAAADASDRPLPVESPVGDSQR